MSLPTLSSAAAERWLSPHRLGVYMGAAGGDTARALSLYDWNARVAVACMRDIGHLEVLLRNRYAAELASKHPDWFRSTSTLWTTENGIPQTRLQQARSNRASRTALDEARRRAPAPTEGHVIANLSLGFWASLSRSERESTIWTPMLSSVFPRRARGPVHDRIFKLNTFRNRLAHWEPVFSTSTGLAARLIELDYLLRELDDDVAIWVGSRSTVVSLLSHPPLPSVHVAVPSYLQVPSP